MSSPVSSLVHQRIISGEEMKKRPGSFASQGNVGRRPGCKQMHQLCIIIQRERRLGRGNSSCFSNSQSFLCSELTDWLYSAALPPQCRRRAPKARGRAESKPRRRFSTPLLEISKSCRITAVWNAFQHHDCQAEQNRNLFRRKIPLKISHTVFTQSVSCIKKTTKKLNIWFNAQFCV